MSIFKSPQPCSVIIVIIWQTQFFFFFIILIFYLCCHCYHLDNSGHTHYTINLIAPTYATSICHVTVQASCSDAPWLTSQQAASAQWASNDQGVKVPVSPVSPVTMLLLK